MFEISVTQLNKSNPGEMYCWITRVWSVYGFEILQGILEGPIVFGRIKDASVSYCDARMSGYPTTQRIV